jgi:hypothetical protein
MPIVGDRSCLAPAAGVVAAELAGFRSGLRECFTSRGDALFELADALACAPGPVEGLPHLSLEPEFRRGWGMVYQALAKGAVDAGKLRDLLVAVRPAGPAWFAVDGSAYPKLAAVTSPDRTYVHHPSLQVNDSPYVPSWNWQWVAQVGTQPTSWTAPLDAARVPADSTASRIAAGQVRDLVARLGPGTGEVPLFIFDAGYDATGLAMDLHHGPEPVRCQVLVRLRKSRVFYTEPEPRKPGARGRTATHGPRFRCADPATWPVPSGDLSWQDPVYGRVRVRAWRPVHPRIDPKRDQPGHTWQAPQPIIRGTVMRVDVEHLRGVPGPGVLVAVAQRPRRPGPGRVHPCLPAPLRHRAHLAIR